uniref:Solute carrier family 6 (Proline IMINO transporter), member 20 n=1 Tax=Nothobranchius rachovii TaxID=451742 RepID=A0A1A8RZY6_9TELE
MFNDYGATFSLLFIVLIEVTIISYYYGIKRFEKDIEDMLGHRPNWYWKIMWAGKRGQQKQEKQQRTVGTAEASGLDREEN